MSRPVRGFTKVEKTLAEYESAVFKEVQTFGYDREEIDLDEVWDDWIDGLPSKLAAIRQVRHIRIRNGMNLNLSLPPSP